MKLSILLMSLLFLGADVSVPLTPRSAVVFASLSRAREILAKADSHLCGLSLFDRQARLGREEQVGTAEIVRLFRGSARAWTAAERRKISKSLRRVGRLLAPFDLPLPSDVVLVKTSGAEEGGALYTRGNAVMLPAGVVARASARELDRLVLHELFHVLSRQNPRLTEKLYGSIGFRRCGRLMLPGDLRERTIANPDAAEDAYAITVTHGKDPIDVVPVIHSPIAYDRERGGTFFRYLRLALVPVERHGGECRAVVREGRLPLLRVEEVGGFFEQVGRNTGYVTDPQEILADNFVLLVEGARDVPSPGILDMMRDVFRASGGRPT